ncbi:hypothetical protein lerEdw1_016364 [Lerista edwardsae]|nr:hypothetical protein lerEdw1_016364 [Lerista edwardsae]
MRHDDCDVWSSFDDSDDYESPDDHERGDGVDYESPNEDGMEDENDGDYEPPPSNDEGSHRIFPSTPLPPPSEYIDRPPNLQPPVPPQRPGSSPVPEAHGVRSARIEDAIIRNASKGPADGRPPLPIPNKPPTQPPRVENEDMLPSSKGTTNQKWYAADITRPEAEVALRDINQDFYSVTDIIEYFRRMPLRLIDGKDRCSRKQCLLKYAAGSQ